MRVLQTYIFRGNLQTLALVAITLVAGAVIARWRTSWTLALLTLCVLISNLNPVAHGGMTVVGQQSLADVVAYAIGFAAVVRIWRARIALRPSIWALVGYAAGTFLLANLITESLTVSGWGYWIASLGLLVYGASKVPSVSFVEFTPAAQVITGFSTLMLWLQLFQGQLFSRFHETTGPWDARGLLAGGALLIGMTLIAQLWGFQIVKSAAANFAAAILNLVALVSLQQRAVWLATALGVLVCLMVNRHRWASGVRGLADHALKGLSITLLVFLAITASARFAAWSSSSLENSALPVAVAATAGPTQGIADRDLGFTHTLTDTRNWSWRLSVWTDFMAEDRAVVENLFGVASTTRWVDGWGAHSLFVESLARFGVVGFLILSFVIVLSIFARGRPPSQSVLGIFATPMLVAFGVAYEPPAYGFLLIGMSLSIAYGLAKDAANPRQSSSP